MTLIVKELRKALVEAGASEDSADAAAMAVTSVDAAAGKQDLADFRRDMETGFADVGREFADVRRDMETGFADVRPEFADVRREMETGFTDVRLEIADVRRDMETGFADVRREMAKLKVHLMAFQLAIGGLIVAVPKFL